VTDIASSQDDRNAEIFVRHCAGETFAQLSAAYGISRNRAWSICRRAAYHLVLGLPMTLPSGNGAWRVAKRRMVA
jgi:hypothetical protein